MDIEIPDYLSTHELIKTAKIFWLLDQFPETGAGWALPVYFDRTSDVYRVFSFPRKGLNYESSDLAPDGRHRVEVTEPVQFAKDCTTTDIYVIIRDA